MLEKFVPSYSDVMIPACHASTAEHCPHGSLEARNIVRAAISTRTIADACGNLEVPAVLTDHTGRVIHVGSLARASLLTTCDLRVGHVMGRTRASRASSENAITHLLSDRDDGHPHKGRADQVLAIAARRCHPSLSRLGRTPRSGPGRKRK